MLNTLRGDNVAVPDSSTVVTAATMLLTQAGGLFSFAIAPVGADISHLSVRLLPGGVDASDEVNWWYDFVKDSAFGTLGNVVLWTSATPPHETTNGNKGQAALLIPGAAKLQINVQLSAAGTVSVKGGLGAR